MRNKNLRYDRIFICGPSGTGKSTLAKYIHKEYNIPFITTSTKPLWDKHGLFNHRDLIRYSIINPSMGHKFQIEVLEYRDKVLQNLSSLVTDRSPIDNIVYYLLQVSAVASRSDQEEFYREAGKQLITYCDALIFIPFTPEIPLEDDGARVVNPQYQSMVSVVFEKVLADFKDLRIPTLILDKWDWKWRTKKVDRFIYNPFVW